MHCPFPVDDILGAHVDDIRGAPVDDGGTLMVKGFGFIRGAPVDDMYRLLEFVR